MSKTLRTLFASSVLLVAAVLSAASSGPQVSAAAKADVDRRVGELRPTGTDFGAPAAAEPMALAVGQWATFKQTDDQGRPSFVSYKIVGQDADGWWYETATDDYYGHSAMRMKLAIGDRRDPSSVSIRGVWTKDKDGRVQELPPPVLEMTRSTYAWALENLVIRWTEYPQEDVEVVAGRFPGAYRGRATVQFLGFSYTSDSWYHPAVPVNGLVRSAGVDKPNITMELVAFGTSGAQSEF